MNVNMMVEGNRKRKRERSESEIERAKKSVSFKKRKACLVKKTMELSVLCDIQACIVIRDVDGEVTMWPENQNQVMEILQSSKNVSPPINATTEEKTVPPGLLLPALLSDDPLDWEDSVLEYLLKDSDFSVSAESEKEAVTNNNILDFQELMEKVDERLQAVTERIKFLESSSPSSSSFPSSGEFVDENPSISITVSEPDQIATVVSATQSQTPFFDYFEELGFAEEEETLFPQLCFLEENDGFSELFPN